MNNESTAAAAADDAGAGDARERAIPAWRILVALIRRELWEHRGLLRAPAIIAALLLVLALFSHFGLPNGMGPEGLGRLVRAPYPHGAATPVDEHAARVALAGVRQWAVSVPLYLVAGVVTFYYLLSALFDERKDRSILFWKSLPVSDAATVLSKLLVASVVVPLTTYVIALATGLLLHVTWALKEAWGSYPTGLFAWDTVAWLKVSALMLWGVIAASLWYAPVTAYLLLLSAWARRNVFVWAVVPPVLAPIIERLAFGTHYIASLLRYRLLGGLFPPTELSQAVEHADVQTPFGGKITDLQTVFDTLDVRPFLTSSGLWLGLIAAAVFAYAAIRIRRYRDDS
jgi:ABC-2 type transport system permease protein